MTEYFITTENQIGFTIPTTSKIVVPKDSIIMITKKLDFQKDVQEYKLYDNQGVQFYLTRKNFNLPKNVIPIAKAEQKIEYDNIIHDIINLDFKNKVYITKYGNINFADITNIYVTKICDINELMVFMAEIIMKMESYQYHVYLDIKYIIDNTKDNKIVNQKNEVIYYYVSNDETTILNSLEESILKKSKYVYQLEINYNKSSTNSFYVITYLK